MLRTVAAEEGSVTRPPAAKAKIAADDDPVKRQPCAQLIEKRSWFDSGKLTRKGNLNRFRDIEVGSQKGFLGGRKKSGLESAKDKTGMGFKRDGLPLRSKLTCQFPSTVKQRKMPAMIPVKRANTDDHGKTASLGRLT